MDDRNRGKLVDGEGDYIWRFSLKSPPSAPCYDDPLVEMIRAFLADFLNMGFLTREGERVQVDGFTFTNDSKTIYKIFPDEAQGN